MDIRQQRENEFKQECIDGGRELISAREASRLFNAKIEVFRQALHKGRLRPMYTLRTGKDVHMYWLQTVTEYFAGRRNPDPEILKQMRANGVTLAIGNESDLSPATHYVGWLILSYEPAIEASK